jgi:hypothetical protein
MNIRDNTLICGYCGENIPQSPEKSGDSAGRNNTPGSGASQKGLPSTDETDMDEEETGGLAPYLQPGEQVLIGSLNVTVKKFFFHAYMTDRRIFLIDTQEKKLKVTAKDIPRDAIAGSTIEFSESSDPVLVLSIKSPDDEIKTMKIVFVQSGMDRSSEIDEWMTLLHEKDASKKEKKPKQERPVEPAEEPEPVRPERPAPREEMHPAKKPVKDHEKPPMKRDVTPYKAPVEEQPEPEPVSPPRRAQIRQVPEPARRIVMSSEYDREIPATRTDDVPAVRKPEVQSAMKVAMKSAMKPLGQPQIPPARREVTAHPARRPVVESDYKVPAAPPRRPHIDENMPEPVTYEVAEKVVPEKEVFVKEVPETPQFCHNCGKKLPLEANFCPGCGTRLSQNRTIPNARFPSSHHSRKTIPADMVNHERRTPPDIRAEEPDEDEIEDLKQQPTKPPIKKAPRGSEMTILHKFLRR